MSDLNYDESEITEKVSRLPPLTIPLDPIIEQLFRETHERGGHLLNLHKTNAHAPRLSRAKKPLTYALRNDCDVPRIYRELAICRTAQIVGCDYEVGHHLPMLERAGATGCGRRWRGESTQTFTAPPRTVLSVPDDNGCHEHSLRQGVCGVGRGSRTPTSPQAQRILSCFRIWGPPVIVGPHPPRLT